MLKFFLLSFLSFAFISCGSATNIETGQPNFWFIPQPLTSFSIVLGDDVPDTFDAEVIDLDAFSTTKLQIDTLHKAGKKVFAYVSVGSWEPYRTDSKNFPQNIIGNIYPGWEDEKFLNIKALDTLSPLIKERFDMIKSKGFDGIEADNIDIYTHDIDRKNGTGFNITLADTKKYVDFLIQEAHDRNLSIGQKNAPDLTKTYGDLFDWALLEAPFHDHYAETFALYPQHHKAVFSLSYLDNTTQTEFLTKTCQQAKQLLFTAILKPRDLSATEIRCHR